MKLIHPLFNEALKTSYLSPESQSTLEKWHLDPQCVVHRELSKGGWNTLDVNAFIWAFSLEGFLEFAIKLYAMTEEGILPLDDRNNFAFYMFSRCSPVSILYFALGPERAALLPGFMGNMLLSPKEVSQALHSVNVVFENFDIDQGVKKALQYYGSGHTSASAIREILETLPIGLKLAKERQCYFLSFGTQ